MTRRTILLSIPVLILLAGLVVSVRYTAGTKPTGNKAAAAAAPFHYARQYRQEAYTAVFGSAPAATPSGTVAGGVVPHHLLAAPMIAQFYRGIAAAHPDVIVIIGPNHYNLGSSDITTSQAAWVTPFGNTRPAAGLITALVSRGLAGLEEEPFETEHSVFNHMPFIRYMFPDAGVIPVIVKSSATASELQSLMSYLDAVLPGNSVVIASIDFSHKADVRTAVRQDAESVRWLTDRFTGTVPDVHTDANNVLYALKLFGTLRGSGTFQLLESRTAADFGTPDNPADLTSYVTGYFVSAQ